MTAFRTWGSRNGLAATGGVQGGDTVLAGESLVVVGTAGDGVWTAAAIVAGILQRTGPGANYADVTDSSPNILAALAGAGNAADVAPGLTWRSIVRNAVAFTNTVTVGLGVRDLAGISLNMAASQTREYLWTVLNSSPQQNVVANVVNGSPTLTLVIPPGLTGFPIGPQPGALNITPGMTLNGTGVTAGTRIKNVVQGAGGVTAIVMDANATADGSNIAISCLPTFGLTSIRSTTL